MQKERITTESDFEKQEPDQSYDPVLAAWTNSPSVTKAFLRNGESLTPIQKAGIIARRGHLTGDHLVSRSLDVPDAIGEIGPLLGQQGVIIAKFELGCKSGAKSVCLPETKF